MDRLTQKELDCLLALRDLKFSGAVQDVDTAPVTHNSGHSGQGPEVVEPVPVQNKDDDFYKDMIETLEEMDKILSKALTMSSARDGDSKCTIRSLSGARVSPVSAAEGDLIARVADDIHKTNTLGLTPGDESDENDKNEEERLNEMVGADAPNPITNEELLRTPVTYARSCCDGRGVLRGVRCKEGED
ncbi:hypothetical protein QR685DRAFT_574006 [Neurospora intermedia]|uniref:Uncharacterized protein n=1 Tax=Neurospora intermedia TaxID=5142 RepID=A0ABR3D591_NEUIN